MRYHFDVDRRNAFQLHRGRVLCAKAITDHHGPTLNARNFCRFSKLKDDVETFVHINKCNARLYVSINAVARTRGVVDSFRTKDNTLEENYSREAEKRRILKKIDYDNMRLGKRIVCTHTELNTKISSIFIRKTKRKTFTTFQYPTHVLAKYSCEVIPKEPKLAKKFLRPIIWFHLEVKGIRPLGRIVMKLYTEAAPQVVLEFVRLCFNKQKECIHFVRLFPSLWLEGEISLDQRTLIQKNIEYDKRSMDHGQHNGVLSFALENNKLFKKGILNFSISFKPLSVLNGHRVGFGHVCEGLKVLNCIQDYGTKNGKPTKEIIVSDCGILS